MSQESESENDYESADEGEAAESEHKAKSNAKNESPLEHTLRKESPGGVSAQSRDVSESLSELILEKKVPKAKKDSTCTEVTKRENDNASVIDVKPVSQDKGASQEAREQPSKEERVLLLKEKKELERASKNAGVVASKDARLSTQQQPEEKTSPGWGLVGGWSSSFLSTVASSASTFTSHVTQGIGTVLETVEASLGAPSPEDLAAQNRKSTTTKSEEQPQAEDEPGNQNNSSGEAGHAVSGLLGGVTAFTRVLETTGSKVITGGLDTLELIGKKTMDILTEGDPGLRKKRILFGGDSDTTLSQVLRDAKSRYEERNSTSEDSQDEVSAVCYSKIFDDNQGLVHLEALEILSGRCKAQLEEQLMVLEPNVQSVHASLQELRTTCLDLPSTDDTPDDEATQDFEKLVNEHMSALPINLNIDKIKTIQTETRNWISLCKSEQDKGVVGDAKEIYEKIITSLAELTARSMELFHKMSELLLVTGGDLADLQSFAQHFTGLTAVLCTEIGILTSQFCKCLSTAADKSEDPDAINPLITNVYLEASNSNTYIQDAFQLLIPVFQELAVRKYV